MTALTYDLATIRVLWRRDLLKFFRQPSRLAGALGQPIVFWLVIGSGMAATFRLPGQSVGYLEYFYPGVIGMVVLFASIFSTLSVIEDRHAGFLQSVIAGPGSRAALVLGKSAGAASVALVQAALFLLLAPAAGFGFLKVSWLLLVPTLVFTALALTALGFAVAWWLDNVQAFHAVQMLLLVPLWIMSGAMFPPSSEHKLFALLMAVNPLAYSLSATRHALYGGVAPVATTLWSTPWLDLLVVAGFAVAAVGLAVFVCERKR